MSFITDFLRMILDWIYPIVNNYGLAIIIFTILVRLLFLPLDIKQRKSTFRMMQVQPKINEINEKYANDPEKKNRKTMDLYKKEKISPFSGCLPLLIQFPILIAMYSVMRHIAAEQIVAMFNTMEAGGVFTPDSFLWIHNIWQPDNIVASVIPSLKEAQAILNSVKGSAVATTEVIEHIVANYETVITPYAESAVYTGITNGFALLPILAGLSQLATTALMSQGSAQQTTQQNKIMQYMFPIISVFFCWQYNAAFALYWVASNVYVMVSSLVITRLLEKKYGVEHKKMVLPAWLQKILDAVKPKDPYKALPENTENPEKTEETKQ